MDVDRSGFLGEMATQSQARVDAARASVPDEAMLERALASGPAPLLKTSADGFDIIAEVKLRSPAEGALVQDEAGPEVRVIGQARSYSSSGAAAISALTEPRAFSGDLQHVTWASSATATPVMRKDFLVDAYQVLEARAAGASGVLFIARILENETLEALVSTAQSLGMFSLVECFDEQDINRVSALWHALEAGDGPDGEPPTLLGVNCRDLTTLQVDFERLITLGPRLPHGVLTVAESGLATPGDARAVAAAGYKMALVGSALMRAAGPSEMLRSLLAAGREEKGCVSA